MLKRVKLLSCLFIFFIIESQMIVAKTQTLEELIAYHDPGLRPVQEYPEIDQWVQKLHKKYSTLGFDKIPMYVTKDIQGYAHMSYPTGDHFICLPEKDGCERDELAMLHETGHYHNHKYSIFTIKGQIACIFGSLLASCILVNKINAYNKDQTYAAKIGVGLGGGLLAMLTIKALNAIILRVDETWADQFSCKHADEQSLLNGYLTMSVVADYRKDYFSTFLHRWWIDFGHPLDNDRALQIAKTYETRFGKKLDLEAKFGAPLLAAKKFMMKMKFLLKDVEILESEYKKKKA